MPWTARLRPDASGEAPQALTVAAAPRPGAPREPSSGTRGSSPSPRRSASRSCGWATAPTSTSGSCWTPAPASGDFDYVPSRNPGVPVVEAIVAVLDPVGGHVLVNLATAARAGRHRRRRRPTRHGLGPRQRRPRGAGVPRLPHRGDLRHPDSRFRVGRRLPLLGRAAARAPPPGRGGRAAGAVARQPQLDAAARGGAAGGRRLGPGRAAPGRDPQPRWRPLSPCCCTCPCGCRTTASSISSTPPTAGST